MHCSIGTWIWPHISHLQSPIKGNLTDRGRSRSMLIGEGAEWHMKWPAVQYIYSIIKLCCKKTAKQTASAYPSLAGQATSFFTMQKLKFWLIPHQSLQGWADLNCHNVLPPIGINKEGSAKIVCHLCTSNCCYFVRWGQTETSTKFSLLRPMETQPPNNVQVAKYSCCADLRARQ